MLRLTNSGSPELPATFVRLLRPESRVDYAEDTGYRLSYLLAIRPEEFFRHKRSVNHTLNLKF